MQRKGDVQSSDLLDFGIVNAFIQGDNEPFGHNSREVTTPLSIELSPVIKRFKDC